MESIYNFTREKLTQKFEQFHFKPFKAKQVFRWLYDKRVDDFQAMGHLLKQY